MLFINNKQLINSNCLKPVIHTIKQNNKFVCNKALAMPHNKKILYICNIGSQASAADVTCGKIAFGREMNNFTLFFLCLPVQAVLAICMNSLVNNKILSFLRSSYFNHFNLASQLIDYHILIDLINVNYRTNLKFRGFLSDFICSTNYYKPALSPSILFIELVLHFSYSINSTQYEKN